MWFALQMLSCFARAFGFGLLMTRRFNLDALGTKFSSFGGGGAVSDVTIARFWCFGGDMTETAVIDLVGMV